MPFRFQDAMLPNDFTNERMTCEFIPGKRSERRNETVIQSDRTRLVVLHKSALILGALGPFVKIRHSTAGVANKDAGSPDHMDRLATSPRFRPGLEIVRTRD